MRLLLLPLIYGVVGYICANTVTEPLQGYLGVMGHQWVALLRRDFQFDVIIRLLKYSLRGAAVCPLVASKSTAF